MEGHVIRAKAEKAVPMCWNVNTWEREERKICIFFYEERLRVFDK